MVRAAIFFCLTLEIFCRIFLLTRINVHWDEFHYLSQVYSYGDGTLYPVLQTFHVHLLSWLTNVPGDEIERIILGRTFMLCLNGLALYFLYFVLRRRFSMEGAVFGLIGYGALFEVSLHGASFRSDSMLQFAFATALLVLPLFGSAIFTALLFALALVINLKAGLILGWFWLFVVLVERKSFGWWFFHLPSVAAATAALFLLHRNMLPPPLQAESSAPLPDLVAGFLLGGVSAAGKDSLLSSLILNAPIWAFAVCGLYSVLRTRTNFGLGVIACAGPAMCLFYRNAWPYFLPLSLVMLAVLLAQFFDSLRGRRIRIAVAAIPSALFLFHFSTLAEYRLDVQEQVIDFVHEAFPTPVPYIDRGGMISSYPSVGPLLSSWVAERATRTGRPIFTRELLERTRPRFLIANSPQLHADVLREYFMPFWGPVYIARDYAEMTRVNEIRTRNPLVPRRPIYLY